MHRSVLPAYLLGLASHAHPNNSPQTQTYPAHPSSSSSTTTNPTGFALSHTSRQFTTYPAAIYAPNRNNYTLAELTSPTTETPYPVLAVNGSEDWGRMRLWLGRMGGCILMRISFGGRRGIGGVVVTLGIGRRGRCRFFGCRWWGMRRGWRCSRVGTGRSEWCVDARSLRG